MEQNPKNQLQPQSGLLATCSAACENKEEVAKPEDIVSLLIMWGEDHKLSYY